MVLERLLQNSIISREKPCSYTSIFFYYTVQDRDAAPRESRHPRIAMEWTAYGRTNASLTRLRGSAQRPAEGKGLDKAVGRRGAFPSETELDPE